MNIIFLSILLILTACGVKQTRTTLEVTQSFQGSSSFEGGLIIYGRHSATGKKFSLALGGSDERQDVVLEAGVWNFFAMGWRGVNEYFKGVPVCGAVTQDPNVSNTVSISVSAAGCNSPLFQTAIKPQRTKVFGCGAFYKYTSDTNTYTKLSASDPDNFCENLPLEFSNNFKSYRLHSIEKLGEISSLGFKSNCLVFDSTEVSLPSLQVPLVIEAYHTLADCTSESPRKQTFKFPAGLQAGNPLSYDHLLQGVNSGHRLVLPTSVTRRGYSPFMGVLPRVLCKGPATADPLVDCIADPVFNASNSYHTQVPWQWGSNGDTLIAKSTNRTCDEIRELTQKFSIGRCESEDGNLFGEVSRSPFMCQSAIATMMPLRDTYMIIDMYRRGGKVYALIKREYTVPVVSYSYHVKILDTKGAEQLEFSVSGAPTDLAVSGDGTILVVNNEKIDFYSIDGDGNLSFYSLINPMGAATPITGVETTEGGLFFLTSATKVSSFNLSDNSPNNSLSITSPPIDMKFHNGSLFVFVDFSTTNKLLEYSVDGPTGNLSYISPLLEISDNYDVRAFDFDGSRYVFAKSDGEILHYDINTGWGNTLNGPVLNAKSVITIAPDKYLVQSDVGFRTIQPVNSNTLEVVTANSGECAESFVVDGKTLSFYSKENNHVFQVFEDALEWIGRRNFNPLTREYPLSLFRALGAHRNEPTSGGRLNRVVDMLSPTGVSGLLSDHTCSDLMARVTPLIRTIPVNIDGEMKNVIVTVARSNDPLEAAFCVANTPTASNCGTDNKYDLQIDWSIDMGQELGRMKVKCNRSIGSFETFEGKDGEKRRDLFFWNTESVEKARFEHFSLDVEGPWIRGNVAKFQKSGSESFRGRQIHYSQDSNYAYAHSAEIEKTSNKILILNENLSDETNDFFGNSDPGFANIRVSTNFPNSTPAAVCMSAADANPFADSVSSCSFSTPLWTSSSKTGNLNIEFFQDITSTSTGLQTYFELNPGQ